MSTTPPPSATGLFGFEAEAHMRRHGPHGYDDYASFKPWLRDEFVFRCVYCRCRERWGQYAQDGFSVDHQVPKSHAPDKICEYDNLVYSCLRCNSLKGDLEGILDPCSTPFGATITVSEDGTVKGHTTEAELHIRLLRLNEPRIVDFRRRILSTLQRLYLAGEESLIESWLGFPEDLPNLSVLRPPGGNSRPDGRSDCFFVRRAMGTLSATY